MRFKIGSIGVGKMGGAILSGAVLSGKFTAEQIAVYDKDSQATLACQKAGYTVLDSAQQVYQSCDIVMLAIKPQGAPALLDELALLDITPPIIISIVAGLTEERIHASLPGAPAVLVMPNTPLLLGCGATALVRGKGVKSEDFNQISDIFSAMGVAFEVPSDRLLDSIPLNGSSPAFVYHMIECLARWGEKNGIDYDTALTLTAKTFEGAAKMVLAGADSPEQLITNVCSPGGATLEGMAVLREHDAAYNLLARTAEETVRRAYELKEMQEK